MIKIAKHSWIVFLWLSVVSFGQDTLTREERINLAKENIKELKEGVLVVRIATNNNKITELERLTASGELDAGFKKQLEKELDKTVRDTENMAFAMRDAFTNGYLFSKQVYFIPDTVSSQLFDGVRKGIFLNEDMEIDPSIAIDQGASLYMAYVGTPPLATTSGKKSIIITDDEGEILPAPFPRATNFYTFFAFVDFKSSDDYYVPKAVERLQKALDSFYYNAYLREN